MSGRLNSLILNCRIYSKNGVWSKQLQRAPERNQHPQVLRTDPESVIAVLRDTWLSPRRPSVIHLDENGMPVSLARQKLLSVTLEYANCNNLNSDVNWPSVGNRCVRENWNGRDHHAHRHWLTVRYASSNGRQMRWCLDLDRFARRWRWKTKLNSWRWLWSCSRRRPLCLVCGWSRRQRRWGKNFILCARYKMMISERSWESSISNMGRIRWPLCMFCSPNRQYNLQINYENVSFHYNVVKHELTADVVAFR